MTPIVREFFRGLKERDELDAIIPELLTAMGLEVLSRPMVGTRQYGSDVAAVGDDEGGVRKLFLFSIKRGDLNRREWDGDSDQALRQSLNEIRDAYMAGVAPEHRGLPVVIVITIGGIVLENTLPMINGYVTAETKPGLEYRLWTGDTLTRKIESGALREEVFPAERRTLLRRAAALVEEPEAATKQFARLIDEVAGDDAQTAVERVRILYLALWIVTVWGREAGNLEAPYRASELVVLRSWELLWREIEADTGRKREASHTLHEIISLHLRIWDELYRVKVLPHAASLHALSFAAWSHESVDVNLALFETAGRIALGGLWRLWLSQPPGTPPAVAAQPTAELKTIAVGLANMVGANPALMTPVTEFQGVDLTLALMLLTAVPGSRDTAAAWVVNMSRATRLTHARRSGYPVRTADYETLIDEVKLDDDAWQDATSTSIIQPVLAAFAWALGRRDVASQIDEFQSTDLAHANFQTWVVNAGTEAKLWPGRALTGSSRGSLKIGAEAADLIDTLRREIAENTAHAELSAIKLDHWPILLLGCRVHRLPPPPQLWMPLLEQLAATGPAVAARKRAPTFKTIGGVAAARRLALGTVSHRILMREETNAEAKA